MRSEKKTKNEIAERSVNQAPKFALFLGFEKVSRKKQVYTWYNKQPPLNRLKMRYKTLVNFLFFNPGAIHLIWLHLYNTMLYVYP